MPGRSDDDLDNLLAQGKLSGAVRDRIFDQVAESAGAGGRFAPGWTGRLALGVGSLAAAAAVVALLVSPRQETSVDTLRAKGPSVPSVTLEVSCSGGALAACPVGATLLFATEGTAQGYLSAYAQQGGAGERVWYFSADGESPEVRSTGALQPAGRAVRIGAEHVPGPYVVHLFLTRAPLSRAALLAGPAPGDVLASRDVPLTVTP